MMGPNHWQQRRTGKVRRRLQYRSFIFISSDCNTPCRQGLGDLPQSSSQKAALSYVNDVVATTKTNISLRGLESGNEASADVEESLSRRALESANETYILCSETKDSWTSSVADVSDSEKALQNEKSWSSATHESEHLSVSRGDGINVSVELSSKRLESMKDEDHEQRRGSRKRKPKVPFEEEAVARKPQKKLRRIRIMRHLGLAAPYGSPFISDCVARTS